MMGTLVIKRLKKESTRSNLEKRWNEISEKWWGYLCGGFESQIFQT